MNNSCNDEPNSVACDICLNWIYFSCEKLSVKEQKELEKSDEPYSCRACSELHSNGNEKVETRTKTVVCKRSTNAHSSSKSNSDIHDNVQERNINSITIHQSAENTTSQHSSTEPIQHATTKGESYDLLKAEISALNKTTEQKEKTILARDSRIVKLESENLQLNKQLATSKSYSLKMEERIKEAQASLRISNKRVEHLEHKLSEKKSQYRQEQFDSKDTRSEISDMKNWFLEHKLRQLELDVIKNNTEIMFLKNQQQPTFCNKRNRTGKNFTHNSHKSEVKHYPNRKNDL